MSCCRLDWQHPIGEEAKLFGGMEQWQRMVDMLHLALYRLQGRPQFERDLVWKYDVDQIKSILPMVQDAIRDTVDERDSPSDASLASLRFMAGERHIDLIEWYQGMYDQAQGALSNIEGLPQAERSSEWFKKVVYARREVELKEGWLRRAKRKRDSKP